MNRLPKSIISHIKTFFGITDNIKIQLINTIWYSTKYSIIKVSIFTKHHNEMLQYIINKIHVHHIEDLDLSFLNITNDIINFINSVTKLKKLNLEFTNIRDHDIKLLKGKNMCDLNISHCKNLTCDCMKYIACFSNLQNLNLSYCCGIGRGRGNVLQCLEKLNNLRSLILSNFCGANDGLVYISKINNLEKLDITKNKLNVNNIKYLKNNKKLDILYITTENRNDIINVKDFKIINVYREYSSTLHSCKYLNIFYATQLWETAQIEMTFK
jgi:hypothetical protein